MSATGTSGPAFSQVIHAEIARYGFPGATVLALIRFRCLTPGSDRVMVNGVRHWKVSYADIGKILGVSKEQVRGAVTKCGTAITANEAPPVDDRKKAFHVPPYDEALTCRWDSDHTHDMQVGFSPHPTHPAPEPVVDSTHPVVDSTHPVVDSPHAPLSVELEESVEGGAREPEPLDAEIVPDPANAPRKQTRSRSTPLPDGWMPTQHVIDAMKAKFPNVNLQAAHESFTDHHRAHGSRMVDWNAAWRNWVRKEPQFRRGSGPTRNGRSTSDERAAQVQALKDDPGPRELE